MDADFEFVFIDDGSKDNTLPVLPAMYDAVIGVEGDVMPVLYDYPHLVPDPRTEEQAAEIMYYVAKMEGRRRLREGN